VRLGAVARIAAACQHLAHFDALAKSYPDAVVLQVADGNHGAAAGLDQDMVASEPRPACCGPARLGEGVTDRWQATEGCMIGFGIVDRDDGAVHRRQDGPTKAWEACRRLRYRSEAKVIGAVRPDSSTGTKSIAKDEAYRVVPWLGTRLAGLFWVSHRPLKG
jgi:hypothetical protein